MAKANKSGVKTAARGQTGAQKKAALAAAKAGGDAPAKAPKESTGMLVPVIKASALSTDVGPIVIRGLAEANKMEQQANELLGGVRAKRYDLLSQCTFAIVKAAKADNTIDVTVAFSGDPKQMNVLNAQLGLALGFREAVNVGKDGKQKLVFAKSVVDYFPPAGATKDDKETDEYKAKQTTRTNFLHMLKKCAQAASGIISTKTEMKMDKEAGTLRLSGPAIKAEFGADRVLLDEKKSVGEGKKKIELLKKPSFTEIASMGAAKVGKTMVAREQSRKNLLVAAGASGAKVDPLTAFVSIMSMAKDAINKLPEVVTEPQKKAMESVRNAIDVKLGA